MRLLLGFVVLALGFACAGPENQAADTQHNNEVSMEGNTTPLIPSSFDFQGHRGCRGLLPENTIPAFLHALDLGVSTLEMDVVITSDSQVLLSHEPWFSAEICLDPQGNTIQADEEKSHLIYQMTYEEIKAYDCGAIGNPRFPDQQAMSVSKPLLSEVIAQAEQYARDTGRDLPFYNIETKCSPEGDGQYHPTPDVFAQLLVDEVIKAGVASRTTIQSFDPRTLQYLHGKYPELRLALLIENGFSPDENLKNLRFTPHIYSPYYILVNADLVDFCKSKEMALIPWTVNDTKTMEALIELGVDGLISDFPDRFPSL